jgi:hypothetical protein
LPQITKIPSYKLNKKAKMSYQGSLALRKSGYSIDEMPQHKTSSMLVLFYFLKQQGPSKTPASTVLLHIREAKQTRPK